MLKLVLNVKYLLLLSFLTAAKFYNYGHAQGIIKGSLIEEKSFLVLCTTFRFIFMSTEKIKTNIQH